MYISKAKWLMAVGKLIFGFEDWIVLKQRGRRVEEQR
jgi:hypothetical protein